MLIFRGVAIFDTSEPSPSHAFFFVGGMATSLWRFFFLNWCRKLGHPKNRGNYNAACHSTKNMFFFFYKVYKQHTWNRSNGHRGIPILDSTALLGFFLEQSADLSSGPPSLGSNQKKKTTQTMLGKEKTHMKKKTTTNNNQAKQNI